MDGAPSCFASELDTTDRSLSSEGSFFIGPTDGGELFLVSVSMNLVLFSMNVPRISWVQPPTAAYPPARRWATRRKVMYALRREKEDMAAKMARVKSVPRSIHAVVEKIGLAGWS